MRDVYFDPFGSYTQGYDKGTERQTQLEQSVRQSRDSDYKYNVLNPYELNKIKRDDAFGAYAVDGTRKLFDNSVAASGNELFNQNDAIARNYAQYSGDFSTVSDPALARFGRTASQGPMAAPTGVTPYNLPGTAPQSMVVHPTVDAATQAVTAAAPPTGDNATANADQPTRNPGQVFWDAWNNVKTKNSATMQVVADTLSKYYNISPEQLHALALQNRPQQQDFSPENTGSILAGHGYTPQQLATMPPDQAQGLAQAIHRSKQTALTAEQAAGEAQISGGAAEGGTPAQAPTAAYNIPPQQPPMQQAPSQATYIRDANGNVVSIVPNFRDNVMGEITRPHMIEDRTFQQNNLNTFYNQQMSQEELKQKYDYDRTVQEQTAAHLRDATGAGAPLF